MKNISNERVTNMVLSFPPLDENSKVSSASCVGNWNIPEGSSELSPSKSPRFKSTGKR